MRSSSSILSLAALTVVSLPSAALAAASAEYQDLQGAWQVVELVDNGRVIPAEAIPTWLPSGGKLDIIDNAMVFTSSRDAQRHARTFSVDAKTYPRQINVIENNQVAGQGIYQIDGGRLVVCLSPPADVPRPTDFSSRENSKRLMMVMTRPKSAEAKPATTATTAPLVAPGTLIAPASVAPASTVLNLPAPPALPAGPQPVTKPLSDKELKKLVPGTWTFNDTYGAFFLTLDQRGSFSTYRQSIETSTYQKVFKKLPLSSGTWKLKNGQVVLNCTSSIYPDRLYKTFPFTIRSVSATNMDFVDYAGNQGKAIRTTPL